MTENELKKTVSEKLNELVKTTSLFHQGNIDVGSFNRTFQVLVDDLSRMIIVSVPVPLAKSPNPVSVNLELELDNFSEDKESFIAP